MHVFVVMKRSIQVVDVITKKNKCYYSVSSCVLYNYVIQLFNKIKKRALLFHKTH